MKLKKLYHNVFRFDFSEKVSEESDQEVSDKHRKLEVCSFSLFSSCFYYLIISKFHFCRYLLISSLLQVISKLHSILRPFLLRRVKSDVEKMLPRKKEIILYTRMTDHQKELQDHLVNKTFDNYLTELGDNGSINL